MCRHSVKLFRSGIFFDSGNGAVVGLIKVINDNFGSRWKGLLAHLFDSTVPVWIDAQKFGRSSSSFRILKFSTFTIWLNRGTWYSTSVTYMNLRHVVPYFMCTGSTRGLTLDTRVDLNILKIQSNKCVDLSPY